MVPVFVIQSLGFTSAAQIKLGWTVDYYPTNELVAVVNGIAEDEIDAAYKDLEASDDLVGGHKEDEQ